MKKSLLFALVVSSLAFSRIDAQLSATVSAVNVSCGSSNNGSASVTATGGSDYSYKWSTGDTTSTASGLSAGTYTVTVYGTVGNSVALDTIYQEDFQGTNTWTLNVSAGYNESQHNYWVINDTCGGTAVGTCSQTHNGKKTLHITAVDFGFYEDITAMYNATEGMDIVTNIGAQSPPISTIDAHDLILSFDFIGDGQSNSDVGSAYYSIDSGTTFILLDSVLRSAIGCIGDGGIHQGIWTHRSYHLPSSCVGVSNFMVRFVWKNNDDNIGTDPALGVNDVILGDSVGITPITQDSVVKTVTIDSAGSVEAYFVVYDFFLPGTYYARNESTGTGLHYHWAFGDGTSYDGPSPIYAFATAGYWSVCLTVSNNAGCSNTYCDSDFYDAFLRSTQSGPMMSEFIVGDVPTGVQEVNSGTSLQVYPNPASGELNIPALNFQPKQVIIYNVEGRVVQTGKYSKVININLLSPGLYFIEVKDENTSMRQRFMKL